MNQRSGLGKFSCRKAEDLQPRRSELVETAGLTRHGEDAKSANEQPARQAAGGIPEPEQNN